MKTGDLPFWLAELGIVAGILMLVLPACPIRPILPRGPKGIHEQGHDGAEMAYIPAGVYLSGSTHGEVEYATALCEATTPGGCDRKWFANEIPQREVTLDAYWIDVHEVSNAQFQRCVEEGGCNPPNLAECRRWDDGTTTGAAPNWTTVAPSDVRSAFGASAQPVVCVSWDDAADFCQWASKRLPTEAEWEKAARGTDGRIFPWGSELPTCSLANFASPDQGAGCGNGATLPVGSGVRRRNPYDLQDMSGNAIEWVFDYEDAAFYKSAPSVNPVNRMQSPSRVVRGGSWTSEPTILRSANRGGFEPDFRNIYTGFRCAMTPSDDASQGRRRE